MKRVIMHGMERIDINGDFIKISNRNVNQSAKFAVYADGTLLEDENNKYRASVKAVKRAYKTLMAGR